MIFTFLILILEIISLIKYFNYKIDWDVFYSVSVILICLINLYFNNDSVVFILLISTMLKHSRGNITF